ncbi:flavin monoamine oxidase family protein [Streptomyces sp. NPDC004752]
MDVIVVGAGLAGLIAARDLLAAGRQVQVLEARDRVGGRTWSTHFPAAGITVDLGAEWVTPYHHTALMRELHRYGHATAAPADGPHRWHILGDLTDAPSPLTGEEEEQFHSVLATMDADAARIDFSRPDWDAGLEHLDVPFVDYLVSLGGSERVNARVLARAFELMGADEKEYSALHLLHEFSGYGSAVTAFDTETHRIVPGADALARSMAAELGDQIVLGTPVADITIHELGCRVTTVQGKSYDAATVIVAAPVNCLSDIRFTPALDLPAPHAGRASKTWARVDGLDAQATSGGWPAVPETYAVSGAHGTALAAFQLHDQDNNTELTTVLRTRYPQAVLQERLVHDWCTDPHARGTWCTARPGQLRRLRQLADHEPPLLFAGGDISRRWIGWMDGALTSGTDAATRAEAHLKGQKIPSASG